MTGNWKSILRLYKNKTGRDFVCGDIHGCFDDLEKGLQELGFNKANDRLFCTGDLIDRGPRSELAASYMGQAWFFTVMGNHEHLFFMGHSDDPKKNYYIEWHIDNGGLWSYKMDPKKAKAIQAAIDKLPLIIQVDDVIIAHAVLPDVESLEEIEKSPETYLETILWERDAYPSVRIPGINRVYVGHSIVNEPKQYGKTIDIDTGAFLKYWKREGKLTILQF